MKNICLIFMLLMLATFFSCKRESVGYKIDGIPLTFINFTYVDSCLSPLETDSGILRFDYHIAYVSESDSNASIAKNINKEIISYEFGSEYKQNTIEEAAADFVRLEKEVYMDLWTDGADSLCDECKRGNVNYEYTKSSGFVKGRGGVLCYETSDYIYEAGAHGIYGNWVLNFDCSTGRLLSYSDVFAPDKDAHVRQIVQRHLIEMLNKEYDANVTTVQDLKVFGYMFEENLLPSANVFRLGEDGVTFIYGVYAIAPYALGETFVTVPYEAIEHCIRKDALEILER